MVNRQSETAALGPQAITSPIEHPAMAKKRAAREEAGKEKSPPKAKAIRTRRKLPNWPVLILALLGMGLAGFLTGSVWLEQALPYCSAGSACDIVQSSRWSRLLGIPISGWGFGAFALVALIAWRLRGAESHWKVSWTLALLSAAISLYLTAIALFVLEAACFYCLGSTAIALALLAVIAYQSPRGLPDFTWRSWLAQTGGLAAVAVVVLHLYYSGWFSATVGEEDPYFRALAEHLARAEAQFFGAQWCSRCDEQKTMFGASASRLPYVECSPGGRNAPVAAICAVNGVSNFPTWIIRGRRYAGVLSADELARYSGFVPPAETPEPASQRR